MNVSQLLKQELKARNVYSKFSVLGIGAHDADFMAKLAAIGTERGLYNYIEP